MTLIKYSELSQDSDNNRVVTSEWWQKEVHLSTETMDDRPETHAYVSSVMSN